MILWICLAYQYPTEKKVFLYCHTTLYALSLSVSVAAVSMGKDYFEYQVLLIWFYYHDYWPFMLGTVPEQVWEINACIMHVWSISWLNPFCMPFMHDPLWHNIHTCRPTLTCLYVPCLLFTAIFEVFIMIFFFLNSCLLEHLNMAKRSSWAYSCENKYN